MKDKVAQRERTEEIVGGARTFNEFVKERAQSHNLTPACVRSLPEIKEEWKQLKAKQLAEKKAEKAKTAEAKKAERKALAEAKKAEKKASKNATTAVVKEKTAIKKVAKKANADAENIKMVLVEKAKASVPPAEPKVKGRPKKYATPEEARRAKIEATKVLNKAKKEAKKAEKASAPAPKPVFVPIHLRKNGKKTPANDELQRWAEEDEREQMGAEDMSGKKQRARQRRVARQRKENETMGMEDEDVPTHFDPDVKDAELKVYMAKTPKDLDGVLSALRRAEKKYDKLDKYNRQSYDHTLQVYANKRKKEDEMFKTARENLAMFKKAKANAPQRRKEIAENEAMGAEDINRARKTPKPKVLKIKRRNVGQLVKEIPYNIQFPKPPEWHGKGFNPDDLKEFNNYGKIQEHLGQHLNDLKEAIDPKDLRDYIHFTKEKARLKSKLVGGLVRMIGGELSSESDSDSSSDSGSEMEGGFNKTYWYEIDPHLQFFGTPEKDALGRWTDPKSKWLLQERTGGGDFFGNIKRAFTDSWNKQPQSQTEKNILNGVLNYAEPTLLAPLNVVAPPVAKIDEAQRQLLKSKYGV